MEKISDFFSELKERISNPFILSYLISWCVWNYEIVIGLAFYKNSELKLDGYNSYLDLILCNSSTWHFLWLPLISALVYTFGFPLFKNLILASSTWYNSWGSKWNFRISKKDPVSSERYLALREKYESQIKRIAIIGEVEKEFAAYVTQSKQEIQDLTSKYGAEKEELIEENKKIKGFHEELAAELGNFRSVNNWAFYNGTWYLKKTKVNKLSLDEIENETPIEYNVRIEDNTMTLTTNDSLSQQYFLLGATCNLDILVLFIGNSIDTPKLDCDTWLFNIVNKKFEVLKGKDKSGAILELRRITQIRPPSYDNA